MQFGFYPDRFVDSLQYMLKGLVGIFLVTGLIILVLVVMDKAGNRKKKDAE
ncbi:MAG: sodium pump decarboxylase gamma subunit [Clostridia bacterium]|nr:sodium pump decarboxylase gamma subunit [Clostridia bacterium]